MNSRIVLVGEEKGLARSVAIGPHRLTADEPEPVGTDTGPTPVELLLAALGSCASMAVRASAQRHAWPLERVDVAVRFDAEGQVVKNVGLVGELTPSSGISFSRSPDDVPSIGSSPRRSRSSLCPPCSPSPNRSHDLTCRYRRGVRHPASRPGAAPHVGIGRWAQAVACAASLIRRATSPGRETLTAWEAETSMTVAPARSAM